MLPGGRLRLSQNVTLKLITPSAPSLPQLSGAVHVSKATPLPRLQDAISIKIVIPARRKRHIEPRQHPDVVDNPPPSIEKLRSQTETPQVSQVEPNASSTTRLRIVIPPLKARSFIAEEVDPGNISSELPDLLYPSDREALPVDPPLVPTVPLTPRESNVSTPFTSPLRAGFAPLPSVQGPFRMLRVLQEGGFATAWAAEDMPSGRLLCLKVFRKDSPKHHHAEEDLLNELEVYKRIATSKEVCIGKMFIMELEMSFRTVDCICLAMDLMTNDLHHYMRTDSAYCHANARRWGAQLALGIHALHGMGIIHRDLKPENVLIDARENVRIADFGLSYIDKKPLHPWGAYTSDVMGTTQIMAPEIIYNKLNQSSLKYGLRVDWWSFGCVLYEIVSLEHKSLFPTADDITAYVTRCYRDRKLVGSLPALNELDPCVGSLISGLVRASEGIRYGFQEVRKHPWFVATNGVSEFDNACSRALRRIECPQLLPDLDDEGDEEPWVLVPLPARPCGRRCCPEVDWVNPRSGVVNNLPF